MIVRYRINRCINESDSRVDKTEKTIRRKFHGLGFSPDDKVSDENYYVNGNPNTTWIQYFIFNFRHTFGLMSNSDVKYMPWLAEIAYGDAVKFDMTNDNGEQVDFLINVVKCIKDNPGIYEKIKNITDFQELSEFMEPVMIAANDAAIKYANTKKYGKSNYEIKEITSFDDAKYYGDLSCPKSKLCYTQNENTWDSYTKHGRNRVYVCLKDGWKNVPCVPGKDAPYDDYGLSMIFVFIGTTGCITTSNTRWNHENAGNTSVDHSFTPEMLCDILNVNFYDKFKPYSEDDLMKKGFLTRKLAQKLIDSGRPLEYIFDDVIDVPVTSTKIVEYNGIYSLVVNGNLKDEYDFIDSFVDGVARATKNGKWGVINTEGEELTPFEYDRIFGFKYGIARAEKNDKLGFINIEGEEVIPFEYDGICDFKDGIARAKKDGKRVVIDLKDIVMKIDERELNRIISQVTFDALNEAESKNYTKKKLYGTFEQFKKQCTNADEIILKYGLTAKNYDAK